jgi:DNA-binding SARP family transcriptional activator
MIYAMRAEAGSNACSTRMAGEASGAGTEISRTETSATVSVSRTAVRIFTLGRFSMAIDDEAPCSKGKAKHRPLGLLKALIALGGREVASSRLCECLWPDSDGDLGGGNLTVTVHRLRDMLHGHDAVLQHDGKLTLNEKFCWVDVWNFERLANDGLRRLDESAAGDVAEMHLRAALGLYAGDFLARESEESWMLAPRLRLKTKLERMVSALSVRFEQQKRFAEAIDFCLQALERDPLNELLYRRLMSCYLKQGEFASAMGTYLRCREALAKGLASPVSCETERLYLEASVAAAERGITQPVRLAPVPMVRSQSLQRHSIA